MNEQSSLKDYVDCEQFYNGDGGARLAAEYKAKKKNTKKNGDGFLALMLLLAVIAS